MRRAIKPTVVILIFTLAAGFLAACGGSSSPPATGSAEHETATKFARCLREHGVNASANGGGGITFNGEGPNAKQAFEAAQNACKQYRPKPPPITPADQTKHLEAAVKFARCMRSHGVNVPDPTNNGNGIGIQLEHVNPNSPAFQAAQNACQGLLGGPKGGPQTSSQGSSSGAQGAAAPAGG